MNTENLKIITKKIFVEGAKVVTLTAGVKVVSTLIESGTQGVKNLKLDELLK